MQLNYSVKISEIFVKDLPTVSLMNFWSTADFHLEATLFSSQNSSVGSQNGGRQAR
jgi:hypothetical protein